MSNFTISQMKKISIILLIIGLVVGYFVYTAVYKNKFVPEIPPVIETPKTVSNQQIPITPCAPDCTKE